jgi:hypothetical protein
MRHVHERWNISVTKYVSHLVEESPDASACTAKRQ